MHCVFRKKVSYEYCQTVFKTPCRVKSMQTVQFLACTCLPCACHAGSMQALINMGAGKNGHATQLTRSCHALSLNSP